MKEIVNKYPFRYFSFYINQDKWKGCNHEDCHCKLERIHFQVSLN